LPITGLAMRDYEYFVDKIRRYWWQYSGRDQFYNQ
jgi:hypothetical protein